MHTSPKCSVCSTSCKQGTRCLRGFQQRKWAWYFARHRTIFTNSNSAQLCRAHHCRFRRVQLSHSAKERHGGNCKTGSFMPWISCAFAHACERKAPAPQPEPRPRRQQPRQQDHKHFSGSILETDNADIADAFCAGKAKPAKETLALANPSGSMPGSFLQCCYDGDNAVFAIAEWNMRSVVLKVCKMPKTAKVSSLRSALKSSTGGTFVFERQGKLQSRLAVKAKWQRLSDCSTCFQLRPRSP